MTKIKGGKKLVFLLRNEGKIWYEAPCCCFLVDVHCRFRVGSGWLLLFPGGVWMVAVMHTCRHADIKKTKKAKLQNIADTRV